MSYNPPQGHQVNLELQPYSPPSGTNVDFNLKVTKIPCKINGELRFCKSITTKHQGNLRVIQKIYIKQDDQLKLLWNK